MEIAAIRAYLHDLNNALNSLKINAYLLRQLRAESLDPQALEALDAALADLERIAMDFQRQVFAESPEEK